ncbi:hypothetical protein XELAEV_18041756mg [Xenopus laevis]|uniref:Uncharacterized protein n=1 Tax=Xenopus laevis TaxID=8355 RepID=A0A974C2Q1_XENLA|nr:hypothetical protein XELAEV_18041756mg [Xenopus laevis]
MRQNNLLMAVGRQCIITFLCVMLFCLNVKVSFLFDVKENKGMEWVNGKTGKGFFSSFIGAISFIVWEIPELARCGGNRPMLCNVEPIGHSGSKWKVHSATFTCKTFVYRRMWEAVKQISV